ncbi:dihydroneopterin aldolase [Anabaena sp. UHCC 0451]|uniref:dihydroneopterin aldolase n=1 Tax=Anabaena sp. UHCC 0451 TaxID=2055235 RepID=UPI002B212EEC|nr:dihydroneopterin aldolase [Anabaena sp. UHCC 0451]MEA5578821.1 dihydroneopterin aldolase [Anabaena sp. UHCC 0451]
MDYIHLTGIRCYGYIGYLPEEKVLGQWFEIDLKLWMDLCKAAETDAIEDTLDYRTVINLVQNLVKTSKFDLLEKLAGAIADAILKQHDIVTQVQVIVIKPSAPIPDFNGKISIEITRTQ